MASNVVGGSNAPEGAGVVGYPTIDSRFTQCEFYAIKRKRLLSSLPKEILYSAILSCRRLPKIMTSCRPPSDRDHHRNGMSRALAIDTLIGNWDHALSRVTRKTGPPLQRKCTKGPTVPPALTCGCVRGETGDHNRTHVLMSPGVLRFELCGVTCAPCDARGG